MVRKCCDFTVLSTTTNQMKSTSIDAGLHTYTKCRFLQKHLSRETMMKTIENTQPCWSRTIPRVMAAAVFSVMTIAWGPAQAAEPGNSLYRATEAQAGSRNAAHVIPAGLSIDINLGHIFSRPGRDDRNPGSSSHRNEKRYQAPSRNNYRPSEGYENRVYKTPRRPLRNSRSHRDDRH